MTEDGVYCIPNAPHQHGNLWVEVSGEKVRVMNPAGVWWRDRTFTIEEFQQVFKDIINERSN